MTPLRSAYSPPKAARMSGVERRSVELKREARSSSVSDTKNLAFTCQNEDRMTKIDHSEVKRIVNLGLGTRSYAICSSVLRPFGIKVAFFLVRKTVTSELLGSVRAGSAFNSGCGCHFLSKVIPYFLPASQLRSSSSVVGLVMARLRAKVKSFSGLGCSTTCNVTPLMGLTLTVTGWRGRGG